MSRVKLLVLDFDGVLTDGTMIISDSGGESKSVSFRDVMGISRAKQAGIEIAIVSGESSSILDHFASRLEIKNVVKGSKNKLQALLTLTASLSCGINEVCYIGDDVNDIDCFRAVGFAAAPFDAHSSVISLATYCCSRGGGKGAVREVVDLLEARSWLI